MNVTFYLNLTRNICCWLQYPATETHKSTTSKLVMLEQLNLAWETPQLIIFIKSEWERSMCSHYSMNSPVVCRYGYTVVEQVQANEYQLITQLTYTLLLKSYPDFTATCLITKHVWHCDLYKLHVNLVWLYCNKPDHCLKPVTMLQIKQGLCNELPRLP